MGKEWHFDSGKYKFIKGILIGEMSKFLAVGWHSAPSLVFPIKGRGKGLTANTHGWWEQ